MTHFDYIIIGAGAAGLMLADAMGQDIFFNDKKILLLDKDAKKTNDRTWCFWEKGPGQFDGLVYKTWGHVHFGGKNFSKQYKIAPYVYKMIRGIDFYETYKKRLNAYANISLRQETVVQAIDLGNHVTVQTGEQTYTAGKVFNSIFNYGMATHQNAYPVLQQHFKGWTIKADKPVFSSDVATYMDFSIPQKGNTRFMYVLPFSETEALVEYTLFSAELLPEGEYETAINDYLKNTLNVPGYEILEKESGSIPMTCYDFQGHHTKNIRYIGTAGGWAKPSTGYTFMSTARKIPHLLGYIKTGRSFQNLRFKNRFWYYDLLFLDVLNHNNAQGHEIFTSIFKKRTPQAIFKFLDEQTSVWEDVNYIWASPKKPFLRALFKRITSKIN